HHLDDAFNTPIDDVHGGDIDAKAARERRADLLRVELLALDLAAFHRLFRQSFQGGFLLKREPERFHATDQSSLVVTHGCKRAGEPVLVPTEFWPVSELVDVSRRSPHGCGDYSVYSPHNVR